MAREREREQQQKRDGGDGGETTTKASVRQLTFTPLSIEKKYLKQKEGRRIESSRFFGVLNWAKKEKKEWNGMKEWKQQKEGRVGRDGGWRSGECSYVCTVLKFGQTQQTFSFLSSTVFGC